MLKCEDRVPLIAELGRMKEWGKLSGAGPGGEAHLWPTEISQADESP